MSFAGVFPHLWAVGYIDREETRRGPERRPRFAGMGTMAEKKLKVLAIDDDTEFLNVLGTTVRSRFPGAYYFAAADAKAGIRSALANDPDVILLDISLPDMDGYKTCRRLKSQAATKDIPVVFVTATGSGKENRVRCLEAGGDGFLAKPFAAEELEAQLRAMAKVKEASVSKERVRKGLADQVEKHVAELKRELEERVRADAALLESQQLLNGILNSLPVRVFWKSRDLVFLGCNSLFAQDAGVDSPEDLVGKDDRDLVWRDQAELYRADDRQVIESGRPKLLIEEEQTTPSGRIVTLITSKIPLRDSAGKIIGVLGVYMDISERKQAEEALRESLETQEALNSMLQRSLTDAGLNEKLRGHIEAVLALPRLPLLAKGAVLLANHSGDGFVLAAQKGLSPATVAALGDMRQGGHPMASGPGGSGRAAADWHPDFCREKEPHEHHCVPISAGGETLGFLALYLEKGGVLAASQRRFLASVTGLMAENILHARTEAKLAQSQRMESVGRLAGGVAHDFNNILTAISGYTEFILKDLPENDPKRADGLEILSAAKRAGKLTRQLLAFSRRQILSPRAVDLNKCVGDITNMLRRLIGEDIALSTRLAPEPCVALLDAGQLEQVLVNLVVNSRDAMPEGGAIEISTELLTSSQELESAHPDLPAGPLVCLKVSDTGRGMTEEVKKHIFEPFYTTKERGKGTGLGLSTVFGIVKQSGGDVGVESEPGRGTSFRVYFPVHSAAAAAPAAGAQGGAALPRGSETVLLVEDEESLRNLSRRVLVSSGYNVLTASNGAEALKIIKLHGKPVDLLLTDVVMPGMSGRELARVIADGGLARRTLYMSGYTDDAIVNHGVLESGLAFLYKPFSVDVLLLKVRAVLDSSPGQAEA